MDFYTAQVTYNTESDQHMTFRGAEPYYLPSDDATVPVVSLVFGTGQTDTPNSRETKIGLTREEAQAVIDALTAALK